MALDFSNHKKTNIARIAKFAKALFFSIQHHSLKSHIAIIANFAIIVCKIYSNLIRQIT